ncbi:MAG: 3-hydroxyacyl-ACP dehydratase FabZ [Gammaproteobacteria bacterium]|nr:3-hydroxyacyl-ACP dehydratase FabZ [Gammaproteobacteria bacterium]
MNLETMDISKIMQLLPHRFPFLLVDKVVEIKHGEEITAIKNITFNEPFFQGHFPIKPIFPGVLIVEALAQAAGLLAFHSQGITSNEESSEIFYLVGVDKTRFKRPAGPGDQLVLSVTTSTNKRGVWKFEGVARVDGQVAASAELMCAVRDANL